MAIPDNSTNASRGAEFDRLAVDLFKESYRWQLDVGVAIPIGAEGAPKKAHKFDLASPKRELVGECKYFTWTDSGKVPSAKIATLNQALLYLHLLPDSVHTRFVVLPRTIRPGKPESLAEYYCRLYAHLLGTVQVFEVEESLRTVRRLR